MSTRRQLHVANLHVSPDVRDGPQANEQRDQHDEAQHHKGDNSYVLHNRLSSLGNRLTCGMDLIRLPSRWCTQRFELFGGEIEIAAVPVMHLRGRVVHEHDSYVDIPVDVGEHR